MKYTADILSEIQTWCHYADTIEEIKYGALYNWYAATDARNILISGWHIPTDVEFNTLNTFLGGWSIAGGKLKEIGLTYWGALGGTNEVNFNARGSGYRSGITGSFAGLRGESHIILNKDYMGGNGYVLLRSINSESVTGASAGYDNGNSIRALRDFTTLSDGESGIYVGNDGKVYRTICIGTQEWLADNLAETKYRDGSDIPIVTDNAAWAALVTGAMCYYNNDISNA